MRADTFPNVSENSVTMDGWDREVSDRSKLPSAALVSVFMITYQHVAFIRQALDSVLMQQVNFPYEICLGEDGSTDGTRAICLEYTARYPERFRLFLRDRTNPIRSKYTAAFMHNMVETLKTCSGKYIAMLEGDDYWIDPKKLQKQVEFLEDHPDYSLCFSNGVVINGHGDPRPLYYEASDNPKVQCADLRPAPPKTTTIADLALTNYIHTASVFFRNWISANGMPSYMSDMPVGDWPLNIYTATQGAMKYMPDQFIACRVHHGGAWSTLSKIENYAGIMRVYPHLLASGILPETVQRMLIKKLPKTLFDLYLSCKEAGRMDLYRTTMTAFLRHAPELSTVYLDLLHEKIEISRTARSSFGKCVSRLLQRFHSILTR